MVRLQTNSEELSTAVPENALQRDSSGLNEALIAKFGAYLQVQGFSRHTVRAYGGHLRAIARFLRGKSLLAVHNADLAAFLESLDSRGVGKRTAAHFVHCLRSFCRFLSLAGLPHSLVPRLLQLPKVPRRLAGFHSLEEIERLIAATRTPRERALIELAFATGCRLSELTHMRVEQINWENGSLKILGKGNKERVVFFGKPASKALRTYLRGRTHGFVFHDEHHQKLRIAKVRPHLSEKATYWRASWAEYDSARLVRTQHARLLGNTKKVSRAEAQHRFDALVKGANLGGPPAERPLSARHLYRIIIEIGARAGMKTWPHRLRHSMATAMLNHGAGLREIQELLGHLHVSSTAEYLHCTTENLVQVHRKSHPREKTNEQEEI